MTSDDPSMQTTEKCSWPVLRLSSWFGGIISWLIQYLKMVLGIRQNKLWLSNLFAIYFLYIKPTKNKHNIYLFFLPVQNSLLISLGQTVNLSWNCLHERRWIVGVFYNQRICYLLLYHNKEFFVFLCYIHNIKKGCQNHS